MDGAESGDDSSPIDVIVEDEAWARDGADWQALAADLNARLLERMPDAAPGAVALLLADDTTLQRLNRDFRGKDSPTNVLSFPAPPGAGMLGDVAIAFQTSAREAEAQGKTLRDHAAHLILHGVLHLHGFDHEAGEEEARSMESLERAILAEFGIGDPYEERRTLHA